MQLGPLAVHMAHDTVNSTVMAADEAFDVAARIFAAARARRDSLPARQAALEAHVPGGLSVEELMVLITQQRERARTIKRRCANPAA